MRKNNFTKIEKGIEQADRGELIDHEEVLNKIRKW